MNTFDFNVRLQNGVNLKLKVPFTFLSMDEAYECLRSNGCGIVEQIESHGTPVEGLQVAEVASDGEFVECRNIKVTHIGDYGVN